MEAFAVQPLHAICVPTPVTLKSTDNMCGSRNLITKKTKTKVAESQTALNSLLGTSQGRSAIWLGLMGLPFLTSSSAAQ
jgi:hypothetical protein